jgi:hypothetical protein
MISARIRQLLAYGIFTATLVVASVSQGDAFEARIDQFVVIRNGVAPPFFNDPFGNGNPPPSAAPGFAYRTQGVFAETAGKAIMNSSVGFPTLGLAGAVLGEPVVRHLGLLLTNIDDADLARGLKVDDTIEVRALFDVVEPQKKSQAYGIELSDRSSAQAGDDIASLEIRKSAGTGNNIIVFFKANFETGAVDRAGFQLLEPGHDQILLRLRRPGNSAADREVFASFAYVDGGSINIADDGALAALTFVELSNVGKSGSPITIFNGENFTRAQFLLTVPDDVTAALLVTGSPASISQTVNTPGEEFAVSFVYRFESAAGVLTVSLNGTVLATINAPAVLQTEFQSFSVGVTSSTLRGLTGVPLTFEINSDIPGSTVLLDNIQFPGLANGNFTGGDLSNWEAVGNAGVLVIESPEDATLEVTRAEVRQGPKGDRFRIRGKFITDPAVSDGLNLPEDVSVVFNGFSQTIPADQFFGRHGHKGARHSRRHDDDGLEDDELMDQEDGWKHVHGGILFVGKAPGIVRMAIRDDGTFFILGRKVDLGETDFADPVPFSLRIGNDLGQTEITVEVR